jgi:hypothetical protein
LGVFGHNIDDHIGEDDVIILLTGQFFADSFKFEDFIGNRQVFDDHLLELFLDETVLLLGFEGLVF